MGLYEPSRNLPLDPPLTENERRLVQRLVRHVDMLAELIGPRCMSLPSALEAAAAYIRRTWSVAGYSIETQSYLVNRGRAENLFVEIEGRRRPNEIIVVGAHYDTISDTPGADDNASAVAALLELSRMFVAASPGRTLRFVAFTNEEPPFFYTTEMGSEVYARSCRVRGDKIVGMICLEMLGYYDTSPGSQRYPDKIPGLLTRFLPQRGDFIAFVSNLRSVKLLHEVRKGFRRAVHFPLLAVPLPEAIPEIHFSDHGSFWAQHYPALMVTDTSFFRNPHYHQPSDRAVTLDFGRLARVTQGLSGSIGRIARCG